MCSSNYRSPTHRVATIHERVQWTTNQPTTLQHGISQYAHVSEAHKLLHFCRAMLCISAAYAVMRCLCVCLCVRQFVNCVKTDKHIIKMFSPSGRPIILVFPCQTAWQYSDGTPPPNGGVECRWGRQKSRFWAYIWLQCLLLALQQARCCQQGRRWTTATVSQVMTHRW